MPSLLCAPCPVLYVILDCPELLPHKNEVTDSKTEKRDGDNRDQIRRDDDDTLQKGKGILKTA